MSYPLLHQSYLPVIKGPEIHPASPVASGASPPNCAKAPLEDGSPQEPSSASRAQKRRSPKGNIGKQVHRSVSTPQLQGGGSMSDSDQDKKRNKLGYQRISIACAHCRRRKIRCVLAEGDAQQRCQNCIRLKKECIFYPVDQQTALEGQSQALTKTGTGSAQSSGVSPSPPELNTGRPFERARQFGSFPSLPSNAPPYQGLPLEPGSALPGQGRMPPAEFGYPSSAEGNQQWTAPGEISPQSQPVNRSDEAIASPYWRANPTGLPTEYAGYPNGSVALGAAPPNAPYSFPPHSEMQSWHTSQSPARMYGNAQESGQQGYVPSNMMFQSHSGHPNGPSTYPPLDTHRSVSHPPIPGPQSAPVGTPIAPYGHPLPYMFQPHAHITESPVLGQQPFPGPVYQDNPAYGQFQQRSHYSSEQGPFTSKPPR